MDKNVLKKFAIESRQELMEKISNKIKTLYVDEQFDLQQNGDNYILSNSNHRLVLNKEEYNNRQLLLRRIKEISLEQVIEESAYTWFNRIIAIRYMEIHDYLPLTKDNQSLGIRVLSSKDNNPDPEIMKISNLVNPELDIEFNKEYYGSIQDNNKRFEYILLLVCKKIGRVIPQVFDGITDYIDILIPDNLLNESGYITKLLNDVSEDNFDQVEIIGWLYQYYITEKKEDISENQKIGKEMLPTVTQFFTPDWIVKYMVENSLGKYWIEHGGDINLINNWKYYIKSDDIIQKEKIDPKEIKCIDPCSGSGHILVYMFEILYQIYSSYGYEKSTISESILNNNLYGLEIDNRAGQLSILSVLLKAREYDKNILNNQVIQNLNIVTIQETNTISNTCVDIIHEENNKEICDYLIKSFKDAKEMGSLLLLEKFNYNSLRNEINNVDGIWGLDLKKILPIIKIAEILTNEYCVVVTNPPYLSNKKFESSFSKKISDNYNMYKYDLYSCFMERTMKMINNNGYVGLLTQQTWLNIDSFIPVRKELLNHYYINTMIHLGSNAIDGGFGTVSFVLNKENKSANDKTIYINLREYGTSEEKSFQVQNYSNWNTCITKDFLKMPKYLIAYDINENVRKLFNIKNTIEKYGEARSGLVTRNNPLFLRFWYEVISKNIDFNCDLKHFEKMWYPHIKGGGYRKWYGNFDLVVNWKNNGEAIRKATANAKGGSIVSSEFYFLEGLSWSLSTFSTKFSLRYLPKGFIFNVEAPTLFNIDDKMYFLGLLNSKVGEILLDILSDDLHYKTKDIAGVPTIYDMQSSEIIANIVKNNIQISKEDWDSFETSWNFVKHPLLKGGSKVLTVRDSLNNWNNYTSQQRSLLKHNEEELNKIFIDIYKLQDELTPEVDDKDITIRNVDKKRDIKSFISYAVGCMFGRYSLDEDGLIYAGGEFDKNRYKTYEVDLDNVIPITEETIFGDDIVTKFKTFIEVTYGKETLYENLEYIAEVLGRKNGESSEDAIRRYFVNDFYNDHLKMYQKRPIYWMFDSGKKNGFKCLIYMHRYNEGTVAKVRLDYLHRTQNTYENRLNEINEKLSQDISIQERKELTKKQADYSSKLEETNEYDEKIAHIADQRIIIDLDDGVVENYGKFSVKNPKTGKEESILANSKDIVKKKKEE